ncbi:MAG: HAD-IIIC family phosphatase [Eubacteriales bacterium]|nr:HAD-IIIC family phosphatase [Eubacteriales bacterium]
MIPYPFDGEELLKKSKKIRRELLADGSSRLRKKIAVLGGSTTHDIVRMLELFLLDQGIEPVFYESEYAQYYEDAVFGSEALEAFHPDVILIHTSYRNLRELPDLSQTREEVESLEEETFRKFETVWEKCAQRYGCPVIQNNFEYPAWRLLGNRDACDVHGRVHFVNALNRRFAAYAETHGSFYLHDLNYLAASYGLDRWADPAYWHMYKYAMALEAIPVYAYSVSSIIKSLYGKNKKALALDLDNTLWGGVVGDDGVDALEIGMETPMGQVYREFQDYLKAQKEIGVLLTVDSKNERENALAGLRHPAGVLRPEDFAAVRANWEPKSENLTELAKELNILPESMVFVDDNPAERALVRGQVPGAAVPELGGPETYLTTLDRAGYFEVTNLSEDDRRRSEMYRQNAERRAAQAAFADYGVYLESLEMTAKIGPFAPVYFPRITQLTNKSNQFNLTTKRYTEPEIAAAAQDPDVITLCGSLKDKFGDNGIVSLIIGSLAMMMTEEEDGKKPELTGEKALLIDLWLMSCRVLKRDMEYAMMDALVEECRRQDVKAIFGYYYPTAKNGMVREFYKRMGFTQIAGKDGGDTVWKFHVSDHYENRNRYIRRVE